MLMLNGQIVRAVLPTVKVKMSHFLSARHGRRTGKLTRIITSPKSYGLANRAKITDSQQVDIATAQTSAAKADSAIGTMEPYPKLTIAIFRITDDNASTR